MSLKPELLQEILSHYRLSPWGIHGLAHWARVLENGRRLQAQTGARLDVVELFAVFHDSQRRNDGIDIGHGGRGASLAMALQGAGYEIDNAGLYLLAAACKGHTSGRGSDDITVWTCWDADRLDIGRVGWKPNPKYLFTAPAKTQAMLDWGFEHSVGPGIPDLVWDEWGIRLGST